MQVMRGVPTGLEAIRVISICCLGLPGLGSCADAQKHHATLQSSDPNTRIRAIIVAGRTRDSASVPLLVDRLDDEDEGVRFYAILALDRITGTRLGYDYSANAAQRIEAVERWRAFVREGRHLAVQDSRAPRPDSSTPK